MTPNLHAIPLTAAERREPPRVAPRRTLDVVYAPSLHGKPLPERQWLVDGWIPSRAVTLLGGDGGTGKSLTALQLMVAASLGKPWLGLPTKPVRSFGLFCEDDADEVHIRAADVARHYGATLGDLEGVEWSARSGKANVLMHFGERENFGKATQLWHELVAEVTEFGAQLVVIDTLADTFAGNENFRAQARAYVGLMRDLAQRIDGAVIVTAHPSVAGQSSGTGLSGSTAWNNSVRSRLYLTRPTDDDVDPNDRVLRRMKANYSGIGDSIRMRWEDGVLIATESAVGIDRIAMNAKADRVFMELLRATYAMGDWVAPSRSARNYAPSAFAKHPDRENIGKPAFEGALARVTRSGLAKIERYGRPAEPRSRLAPA
jgi:RecA-family ATPase